MVHLQILLHILNFGDELIQHLDDDELFGFDNFGASDSEDSGRRPKTD